MSVWELTMENFEQEVLKSDKPVLIDFWATWCGPCRMMGPVVDAFAEEHPEIKVGKVNVDDQPQLAAAFGIESIPTLIAIKDGKAIGMMVGVRPKEEMAAIFDENKE